MSVEKLHGNQATTKYDLLTSQNGKDWTTTLSVTISVIFFLKKFVPYNRCNIYIKSKFGWNLEQF